MTAYLPRGTVCGNRWKDKTCQWEISHITPGHSYAFCDQYSPRDGERCFGLANHPGNRHNTMTERWETGL